MILTISIERLQKNIRFYVRRKRITLKFCSFFPSRRGNANSKNRTRRKSDLQTKLHELQKAWRINLNITFNERMFVPLHKKIPPRRHLHSEECHTTKPGSRFRILKIDLTISKYRCRHNTKASDTFKIEKDDNFSLTHHFAVLHREVTNMKYVKLNYSSFLKNVLINLIDDGKCAEFQLDET